MQAIWRETRGWLPCSASAFAHGSALLSRLRQDLDDLDHDARDDIVATRFYDGDCEDPPPCRFDADDRCLVCAKRRDVAPDTSVLIDLARARRAGIVLGQDDISAAQWAGLAQLCKRNDASEWTTVLTQTLMMGGNNGEH